MEQFVELIKALYASMQLQQQRLLQQQEKYEKSQKVSQEKLMQLRTQQTKNTKLFCESVLVRTTEERGSRVFFLLKEYRTRYQNSSRTWTME